MSVVRNKIIILQGPLYDIERTIARSYDDMGKLESGKWWYKKYVDMTPEERKHVCDMNSYYQNKYRVYGLLNANWSDKTRARKLCLTVKEDTTIEKFNHHITNLAYKCRQGKYASLFQSYICVRGIQPDTGHIHCHFILLGVDDSIDNGEYIRYLKKEWHLGELHFEGIEDIFIEANYLIKHLNPEDEQYINIHGVKRMTHAATMNKPVIVVKEDVEVVYKEEDKITGFRHKFSNDETMLFKPGSKRIYRPIQQQTNYPNTG